MVKNLIVSGLCIGVLVSLIGVSTAVAHRYAAVLDDETADNIWADYAIPAAERAPYYYFEMKAPNKERNPVREQWARARREKGQEPIKYSDESVDLAILASKVKELVLKTPRNIYPHIDRENGHLRNLSLKFYSEGYDRRWLKEIWVDPYEMVIGQIDNAVLETGDFLTKNPYNEDIINRSEKEGRLYQFSFICPINKDGTLDIEKKRMLRPAPAPSVAAAASSSRASTSAVSVCSPAAASSSSSVNPFPAASCSSAPAAGPSSHIREVPSKQEQAFLEHLEKLIRFGKETLLPQCRDERLEEVTTVFLGKAEALLRSPSVSESLVRSLEEELIDILLELPLEHYLEITSNKELLRSFFRLTDLFRYIKVSEETFSSIPKNLLALEMYKIFDPLFDHLIDHTKKAIELMNAVEEEGNSSYFVELVDALARRGNLETAMSVVGYIREWFYEADEEFKNDTNYAYGLIIRGAITSGTTERLIELYNERAKIGLFG